MMLLPKYAVVLVAVLLLVGGVTSAQAARPVCGDHNGDGHVGATDALMVLRNAVGQGLALSCDCSACPGSTTTTTITATTTTIPAAVCGNGIVEPGEDCEPSDGLFCFSHCDERTGLCTDIACLPNCSCGG